MSERKRLGLIAAASLIMGAADDYVGSFPRKARPKKINRNADKQKQQRAARKRRAKS